MTNKTYKVVDFITQQTMNFKTNSGAVVPCTGLTKAEAEVVSTSLNLEAQDSLATEVVEE